jgi:hypothetical protein
VRLHLVDLDYLRDVGGVVCVQQLDGRRVARKVKGATSATGDAF